MPNPYLVVTAVIAGVTLLQGANGLLAVLLPLRMSAADFPVQTIGWVAAAHGAGFLIGCVLISRIIAAIGHVRSFAAFAAILSAVVLAFAAWIEAWAWVGLRLVAGVCFAALFTVAESWIADRTPAPLRGRVLGLYMVCNKAALALAPLLLTQIEIVGPWGFMLISALCSLSLLPVTTTRASSPAEREFSALSLRQLYAIAPVGLVGCFTTGLVNGPLLALAPVYGQGVGLSLTQITLLLPALQLGSLLTQWPLGRWSDRGDRRRVIAGLSASVCLLSVPLWLLHQPSAEWILLLFLGLGGAALSIYAICIAHAGDHADADQMVPMVSSLLLAWGVGAVIGPAAAAAVMQWLGEQALFAYTAAISGLFVIFTLWRMRRRAPAPDAEHVHFVNLPATSPVAAELGVADDGPASAETGAEPRKPR